MRLAKFTPDAAAASAALKAFLRRSVYFSELLAEERRRSAAMIAELFGYFLDNPERLPESYREAMLRAAAAPRGVRLYRGHDRRIFPPDV